MLAMVFATLAFSIDAMLPALPEIAAELTPDTPNRAMLIIAAFVMGMGAGTLVAGPLSDSFGRKRVILIGAGIYCVAAAAAFVAPTLEMVLVARLVQGLGVSAPRVVALAIIRDLYAGRDMARITSFVFMVFSLVPAMAPAAGQVIIWAAGWRAIFVAFVVFMGLGMLWLTLRQRETLPPAKRQPFNVSALSAGFREVLGNRIVQVSVLVQSLCFCMLVTALQITHPVIDDVFDRKDEFIWWFMFIAVVAASASIINARYVQRLGMRFMVNAMLLAQLVLSATALTYWAVFGLTSPGSFAVFILWNVGIFFQAGMTLGNLNAIAMEPLGHRAGLAAAVMGAFGTVIAVIISIPIGQSYAGHPGPVVAALLGCAALALALMRALPDVPRATATD